MTETRPAVLRTQRDGHHVPRGRPEVSQRIDQRKEETPLPEGDPDPPQSLGSTLSPPPCHRRP